MRDDTHASGANAIATPFPTVIIFCCVTVSCRSLRPIVWIECIHDHEIEANAFRANRSTPIRQLHSEGQLQEHQDIGWVLSAWIWVAIVAK